MSPHSHGMLPTILVFLSQVTEVANRYDVAPSPINRLDDHQSMVLRLVAILALVVSIAAGCVGFYMLGAIDARRRVFRHHLIFFLIAYDFLKAVTLLFYPARVSLVNHAYYNGNFCNIVGFFTAMAIEGADIAIFSFAIHTALLIFAPNRKYKNGDKVEGGLYPYRWYVWVLSFVIPVVLAALAFVDSVGYQPLVSWCYLPERPRWYRLVLSWVPRYVIVITILCLYAAIYIHVIRQFKLIMYLHEDINGKQSHRLKFDRHLFANIRYLVSQFLATGGVLHRGGEHSESSREDSSPDGIKNQIHEASMSLFDQRRIQIERQMKLIFIYPILYIFLWLAPFALQCIQYDYELRHGPVYWLTAILAFMQPFNCTVDTIVFLFREKPWEYTVAEVSRKIKLRHGQMYANDHFARYYDLHETWRRWVQWLPLYGIPDDISNDDDTPKEAEPEPHNYDELLGSGWDEDDFRKPPEHTGRTGSGELAMLKGAAQTPSLPIDANFSSQKRADTVISTTDFYNMPHRASSVRHPVPPIPTQLREQGKSHLWTKAKNYESQEHKELFGDYEMKEIVKQEKEEAPTSPKVANSRSNTHKSRRGMGLILRRNTSQSAKVEPEEAEEEQEDNLLMDILDFLNRGPS